LSTLDGFSSCLSKKCHTYLIKPLNFLTNLSLSTGRFPENPKTSKIKHLIKNGSAYETEKYIPISLILTFSKILEKIVCIRVINVFENNTVLLHSQHGFHKADPTV